MEQEIKKTSDSIPPQESKTTAIERVVSDVLGTGAVTALAVLKLVPGTWALAAICLMVLPSSIVHYLAKAIAGKITPRGASLVVGALTTAATAKKGLAVLGTAAVLTGFVSSCAAIHAAGNLTAIEPRVIEREEYGTCLESGGSYQRSNVRFSLITQACVDMDASGNDASLDAPVETGVTLPQNATAFDANINPVHLTETESE